MTYGERLLLDAVLMGSDPSDNARLNRLYQDSPEFYHAVNLMVRSLPRIVQVMADEAVTAAQLRERMKNVMNLRPDPGWFFDPNSGE